LRLRAHTDHAKRVQKVAGFLELQGALELVVAFMFGVYWLTNLGNPVRGEIARFGMAYAPLVCAFNVVSGILKMTASRFNRRYRGWGLGVAAHVAAPLTVCSIYCLPTAALLALYGLWVYSQAPVRAAFASAARGTPVAEVEAALRGQ
jgi:hypothetical protein